MIGSSWIRRHGPRRKERRYMLVPTTCFNCESACGLLAYVDKESLGVQKFEGNPEHPGSRGRNCAKGPATLNQITDPDRILYPAQARGANAAKASGCRSVGMKCSTTLAARIRKAIRKSDTTRSCITWGVRARTASRNASWRRGALTATTRTRTSARPQPRGLSVLDGP